MDQLDLLFIVKTLDDSRGYIGAETEADGIQLSTASKGAVTRYIRRQTRDGVEAVSLIVEIHNGGIALSIIPADLWMLLIARR